MDNVNDTELTQREFSIRVNKPRLDQINDWGWLNNKTDRDNLLNKEYYVKVVKDKIFTPKNPSAQKEVEKNALHILGRCNNPNDWEITNHENSWPILNSNKFYNNKQGLVYGMVQSGKTASMINLMALAHSSGYNLLILLSSDKESLRKQTQERITEAFNLTYNGDFSNYDLNAPDTSFSFNKPPKITSLTTAKDTSYTKASPDYKSQAGNMRDNLRINQTMIVCIKKNDKILKRFIDDLKSVKDNHLEHFNKIQALILDDEADYASQNTSNKKGSSSPINDQITEIREVITKNSYVQYTATPQACLSSDYDALVGYPKDFVWLLDVARDKTGKTTSYLGNNEFFSTDDNNKLINLIKNESWPHHVKKQGQGKKTQIRNYKGKLIDSSLPVVEKSTILKYIDTFKKNNKDDIDDIKKVYKATENYKEAIVDFLITCSLRWHKHFIKLSKSENIELPEIDDIKSISDYKKDRDYKDYPYHAMIYNLAYTNKIQKSILEFIKLIFEDAKNDFYNEDINNEANCFNIQYNKQKEKSLFYNSKNEQFNFPSLDNLKHFIKIALRITSENIIGKTEYIYLLNSDNEGSEINYDTTQGQTTKKAAIMIGGHILGRGLTVKNLSTSFFIRSQKISLGDTNLQMCRWFGHKRKDIDLTSLYINKENLKIFKEISHVDNELRDQFWESIHKNKPAECLIFDLINSNLFRVTSKNKSWSLEKSDKSYFSGKAAYIKYPKLHPDYLDNKKILDNFLEKKKPKQMLERAKVYYNIDHDEFKEFFMNLNVEDYPLNDTPEDYINYLNQYKSANIEIPGINIAVFGNDEYIERKNENGFYQNITGGRATNYISDLWIDEDREFHEKNIDKKLTKRTKGKNILINFYIINPNYRDKPHKKANKDFVKKGLDEPPIVIYVIHTPYGGPTFQIFHNKKIKERNAKKCHEWEIKNSYHNE